MSDDAIRHHLLDLLKGGNAHATFDAAVDSFPVELAGIRPVGLPHSAWELLEHLRISQNDILEFSRSPEHVSPAWPEGYWPKDSAPPSPKAWAKSVQRFRDDLAAFEKLLVDPKTDLTRPLPSGEGQTLLREALLIADHNSYHLGQLVLVRRALNAWPA